MAYIGGFANSSAGLPDHPTNKGETQQNGFLNAETKLWDFGGRGFARGTVDSHTRTYNSYSMRLISNE
jgi:hypothetical protein